MSPAAMGTGWLCQGLWVECPARRQGPRHRSPTRGHTLQAQPGGLPGDSCVGAAPTCSPTLPTFLLPGLEPIFLPRWVRPGHKAPRHPTPQPRPCRARSGEVSVSAPCQLAAPWSLGGSTRQRPVPEIAAGGGNCLGQSLHAPGGWEHGAPGDRGAARSVSLARQTGWRCPSSAAASPRGHGPWWAPARHLLASRLQTANGWSETPAGWPCQTFGWKTRWAGCEDPQGGSDRSAVPARPSEEAASCPQGRPQTPEWLPRPLPRVGWVLIVFLPKRSPASPLSTHPAAAALRAGSRSASTVSLPLGVPPPFPPSRAL